MGAVIIGCGKAIPSLEIHNDELEKLVDTNDEWIRTRTGIQSRHVALNESTLDLAKSAALAAMGTPEQTEGIQSVHAFGNNIDPDTIDLIVFPTITPDTIVPSSAAALKRMIGFENAVAFDINAACSGFLYGLCIAETMMAASNAANSKVKRNKIKRALIVSSERLTKLTDWSERSTCVLFGDGAGAAVVEWQDNDKGILATYLQNDDDTTDSLTCMQQYESAQPFCASGIDVSITSTDQASSKTDAFFEISDEVAAGGMRQVIRMDGQTVFKFASKTMCNAVNKVVEDAGLTLDDIKIIIPHQANERIISYAAKRLGLPIDKFQISIAHTGNTSSSGEPMALADAFAEKKIVEGDRIVLVAFGGGLTSGAILIEV